VGPLAPASRAHFSQPLHHNLDHTSRPLLPINSICICRDYCSIVYSLEPTLRLMLRSMLLRLESMHDDHSCAESLSMTTALSRSYILYGSITALYSMRMRDKLLNPACRANAKLLLLLLHLEPTSRSPCSILWTLYVPTTAS
jgi:hypothetical protein